MYIRLFWRVLKHQRDIINYRAELQMYIRLFSCVHKHWSTGKEDIVYYTHPCENMTTCFLFLYHTHSCENMTIYSLFLLLHTLMWEHDIMFSLSFTTHTHVRTWQHILSFFYYTHSCENMTSCSLFLVYYIHHHTHFLLTPVIKIFSLFLFLFHIYTSLLTCSHICSLFLVDYIHHHTHFLLTPVIMILFSFSFSYIYVSYTTTPTFC